MQNSLAVKIVNILFYILLGVSFLIAVLFFLSSDKNPDVMLYWNYLLVGAAGVLVFGLSIINMFSSRKSLISSLIILGISGVLIFGTYAMSSGEMPKFFGSEAFNISSAGLKWIDTSLYLVYLLSGVSFVGLIVTEVRDALN